MLVGLVAGLVGAAAGAAVAAVVLLGSADRVPAGLPAVGAVHAGGVDGVADVAATVLPSVVRIEVRGIGLGSEGASGSASGVVWDDGGHVVTNHHVVAGATGITVITAEGDRVEAALVGADPTTDLAVVRIPADVAPAPAAVAAEPAVVGQLAVVVGAPFGLEGSVAAGIISAVDRPVDLRVPEGGTVRLPGVLQTDAGVNPGSSGGPVVDARGRVIGIASAVLGPDRATAGGGAVGFAIPAPLAADVVAQLIAGGTAAPPVLGVAVTAVDGAVATALGVEAGVVVERVAPGSPAAVAGLAVGDVLVAAGEADLRTVDDLLLAVRRAGAGGTIELRLAGEDGLRTVAVTLAAGDPGP